MIKIDGNIISRSGFIIGKISGEYLCDKYGNIKGKFREKMLMDKYGNKIAMYNGSIEDMVKKAIENHVIG